jgi:hypothetical protein
MAPLFALDRNATSNATKRGAVLIPLRFVPPRSSINLDLCRREIKKTKLFITEQKEKKTSEETTKVIFLY